MHRIRIRDGVSIYCTDVCLPGDVVMQYYTFPWKLDDYYQYTTTKTIEITHVVHHPVYNVCLTTYYTVRVSLFIYYVRFTQVTSLFYIRVLVRVRSPLHPPALTTAGMCACTHLSGCKYHSQ